MSEQKQNAARPRLPQGRTRSVPVAVRCSVTCPASGQSQTLTCFLHEVLIHGYKPFHGGGSICVEKRQIRESSSQEDSLRSIVLQISKFQAEIQR